MAIIPRPSTPPLICVQSSERKLPDWAKQEFIHLVQQLHQHQERLHQVHQQTTSSSMMDQVDLNMNLNPFFHSKSTWTPHAPSFLSFSTPLQEKNHSEYSFLHAHASPPSWTTSTLTSTTTYKPSSPMETELRYYLHEPKAVIALLCTHDPFQVAMAIQMLPFLQIMFLDEQDLEFSQAQLVVRHYLKHPTPFVRLAAIQALLTLHRLFGVRYLDSSIYPFFTPCLSDDNPQATLELGNFGNISTELLLQTLSKKALGISKKEGRDSILSKEWKSHAGAFVHAIEDEFQVVRQAALDSISRLGAKHKNFALGAVYFLIDMTNDEMHQIRKNALKVLCQISAAYDVILTPLDLDDLNEVFHDIDPFVRYDLYTFLGAIRCSNNLVLTNMIRALRINLNLFKEDIQSIFKCVRKIAERNHDFVVSIQAKLSCFME
ncbi:hypothetical protein HMI54_003140 [Coelomomyces lativittatus]|nr:hypothetical protein HMI54_003140 [Coelomomyces lativittatus]